MSNKEQTMPKLDSLVLMPSYLPAFKCIAGACEDSCCIDWGIVSVDCITYEKYQSITDPEINAILASAMVPVNSRRGVKTFCADIKFVDGSTCPFLAENRLCTIQRRLGEEYLSYICATFPRVSNIVNGTIEVSATMACPEACRLALLNPEGIGFYRREQADGTRHFVNAVVNTDSELHANSSNRFFIELRRLAVKILKNRNYSIDERLIILGLLASQVTELCRDKLAYEIPELVDRLENQIVSNQIRKDLNGGSGDTPRQLSILLNLLLSTIKKGIRNQRFFECCHEFLFGIDFTANNSPERMVNRYQAAYAEYYEPFLRTREYIFENYLVNTVFAYLFPFNYKESFFDTYVALVLRYALIKMLLIGMAGYHKGLTEDLVIKLIQSFTKSIEHKKEYLQQMCQALHDDHHNTMEYMIIFIRNEQRVQDLLAQRRP
ncbi:MAG: flagellin lysine-N-methylase [Candidatus Saccharibacteria bacterium]